MLALVTCNFILIITHTYVIYCTFLYNLQAVLLNKGFSPREEVYLWGHSDSPDFISNTLRTMVSVARIVSMDEVMC